MLPDNLPTVHPTQFLDRARAVAEEHNAALVSFGTMTMADFRAWFDAPTTARIGDRAVVLVGQISDHPDFPPGQYANVYRVLPQATYPSYEELLGA